MRKYLGFSFAVVFLMLSMASCAIGNRELTGEEIFVKISQSTVEVCAESEHVSSLGSGFYIDNAGTVVTNYHVIEDCSGAYVITNDGGMYEVVGVRGYSKELDIAVLATSRKESPPVEMCSTVSTGEKVYVLGSSLGLTGTFSEGLVSSAERNIDGTPYIQISAPISEGNSGGPVVNSLGQVIGIASAGFEEGQNLNLAIPIAVLEDISTDKQISMEQFFKTTSKYVYMGDRVVVEGSSLAVRTISFSDSFSAEFVLALWESFSSEANMIALMDQYGESQGGGQLYIIDPGVFVEEIDAWCFDPSRQPGDCAIIENPYGYSICYISRFQPD